jgi:threonine aldolase
MGAVKKVAGDHGLPVNLDGARIFNAAVTLGVAASDIAACADSVMFCLSKGLCAPVGSLLAGTTAFVDAARYKRKIMGGGMRQAGIIAAAGIVALTDHPAKLAGDHARARALAAGLAEIKGVTVTTPAINMVFFTVDTVNTSAVTTGAVNTTTVDTSVTTTDAAKVTAAFASRGIVINPPDAGVFRFVTHHGIDDTDVAAIINASREIFGGG